MRPVEELTSGEVLAELNEAKRAAESPRDSTKRPGA